jgi:hypothetical protein
VPAAAEQWEAAQRDAREDGRAADDLQRAGRVAEEHGSGRGADEGLQIQERPGHLGGHPALRVGEQREGQQRATGREGDGGQDGTRVARDGRHALNGHRERQHHQGGAQELHCCHRDRVAAAQQPGLPHGERGRQQQRHQHQAIAADRGSASPAAGDETDARQGHREASPGHRARHRAVPESRDDRDQHRRGPDQQCRVGDAGPGDAGVLYHDRTAIPDRT